MKWQLITLLLIFSWLSLLSCEDPSAPRLLAPSPSGEVAAKIDRDDKVIELTEIDKSCLVDEDCIIIDEGCCRGEKRIAVNKQRSMALISKRKTDCLELKSNKFREMQKERDELKDLTLKLRKEKSKSAKQEISKQIREKQLSKKSELCYGRQGLLQESMEVPQCVECKCTIGSKASRPEAMGPKCIEANKYLNDNKDAMLKTFAEPGSNLDKKNGVELWNRLIPVINNSQECACEKYLKELQGTMERLAPKNEEEKAEKKPE